MARRRRNEQPTSVPTGGPLGQRQQLEAAQQAFPLPRTQGPGSTPQAPAASPAPAQGQQAPGGLPPVDVFGPSQRGAGPMLPEEPMLPPDPVGFLRAVAMQYPSPGIMRLLERAAKGGRR